jgi:peptidyl-prolyl cis-trans isomerase SurA
MSLRALLLLAAVAAPSLAAAQGTPPATPPAAPVTPQLAPTGPAPIDSSAIEIDRIVAVVGSHAILLSDVFAEIAYLRQSGMPAPRDAAQLDSISRQVVNDLVNEELLVSDAARQQVEVTDDDVKQQVDQYVASARRQAGSDERLREELQRAGLGTMEQWRRSLTEQFRKRGLREALLAKLRRDGKLVPAPVTEAEIAAAFAATSGAERPKRPATVSFRQIIIAPKPAEAAKKAARARIDSLRVELVRGADFAAVAKRESMDGTAQLGGELGWVRRGKTVPEFEQWAFSLPVGQLSPVIETAYGFHLMRVDSRQPGEVKVRHILIIPQTDSADLARARLAADSVARAWRAGGSYDDLVKRYHDPVEQSLVSDYPLGQLPEVYQTVLRATAPNTVTDPFDIPNPRSSLPKLVVAQVMAKQEEGEYTLDDVRARFRQQLGEKKAFDRYVESLRSQIFVDIRF